MRGGYGFCGLTKPDTGPPLGDGLEEAERARQGGARGAGAFDGVGNAPSFPSFVMVGFLPQKEK